VTALVIGAPVTVASVRFVDPVVVGVDWSRRSTAALRWAAAEAALRGGELVALHAGPLRPHLASYAPAPPQPDPEQATMAVCVHLAAIVGEALGEHPPVRVRLVYDERPVVPALLAHGKDAAMLVLAGRRDLPEGGVALGSTSLALVRNAPCPVVILPADPTR
jgi:nucleotide-binding universal stress UspA family protein